MASGTARCNAGNEGRITNKGAWFLLQFQIYGVDKNTEDTTKTVQDWHAFLCTLNSVSFLFEFHKSGVKECVIHEMLLTNT
jgi:hypothetical protein